MLLLCFCFACRYIHVQYNMLCFALLLALFPFLFDTGHRTWIIGDSIINWSGWDGVSGAKIAGVVDRLSQCVQTRPFPSTLVLHLGTNDIFESPIHEIRKHINLALKSVRNLFPRTRLIWSFIQPRSKYLATLVPSAWSSALWPSGKEVSRSTKVCGWE